MEDTVTSLLDNFKKEWEEGFPTFQKLFDLPHKELKDKVKDICGYELGDFYFDDAQVTKIIKNDKPTSIEIHFYDEITISPTGISFTPEHGQTRNIVKFNKYFTL